MASSLPRFGPLTNIVPAIYINIYCVFNSHHQNVFPDSEAGVPSA